MNPKEFCITMIILVGFWIIAEAVDAVRKNPDRELKKNREKLFKDRYEK